MKCMLKRVYMRFQDDAAGGPVRVNSLALFGASLRFGLWTKVIMRDTVPSCPILTKGLAIHPYCRPRNVKVLFNSRYCCAPVAAAGRSTLCTLQWIFGRSLQYQSWNQYVCPVVQHLYSSLIFMIDSATKLEPVRLNSIYVVSADVDTSSHFSPWLLIPNVRIQQ